MLIVSSLLVLIAMIAANSYRRGPRGTREWPSLRMPPFRLTPGRQLMSNCSRNVRAKLAASSVGPSG